MLLSHWSTRAPYFKGSDVVCLMHLHYGPQFAEYENWSIKYIAYWNSTLEHAILIIIFMRTTVNKNSEMLNIYLIERSNDYQILQLMWGADHRKWQALTGNY